MISEKIAPFALIGLLFARDAATCEMPEDIALPDGGKATEQEMRKATADLTQFIADAKAYQACLAADADRARPGSAASGETKFKVDEDKYVALHNAASEAMAKATATFNAEIEKFEAGR